MFAALTISASARSQKPEPQTPITCDVFKERLVNAEKSIGLVVPTAEFMKDDLDHWVVTNYKDHEATLYCAPDGLFVAFELFTDPPLDGDERENEYTNMRSHNLSVAAIYAYTGWPTKRVVTILGGLLKSTLIEARRAKVRGDNEAKASISLPNKTIVSLSAGFGGRRRNDRSQRSLMWSSARARTVVAVGLTLSIDTEVDNEDDSNNEDTK